VNKGTGAGAEIEGLPAALLRAYDEASLLPLPSERIAGFDNTSAYGVAERLRQLRLARGERQAGWKIGFTNRSIWQRYGVWQPMWAPVWDSTLCLLDAASARLALRGLSQPRIEPEIVFGIARAPHAGMSLDELQACIDWVAHGFEVVHTHFEGWRFTAPDTAADFALHGRLLVGPRVPVQGWTTLADDLSALQVELHGDDMLKDRGQGSVVLDGPLHALKAMVEAMAVSTPQWKIAAGEVVTTGTITDAWPLQPGQRWQTRLSEPRLSGLLVETE
jgi:2-oxo-3-hexenedioate decarboxylase